MVIKSVFIDDTFYKTQKYNMIYEDDYLSVDTNYEKKVYAMI